MGMIPAPILTLNLGYGLWFDLSKSKGPILDQVGLGPGSPIDIRHYSMDVNQIQSVFHFFGFCNAH